MFQNKLFTVFTANYTEKKSYIQYTVKVIKFSFSKLLLYTPLKIYIKLN